MCAVSTKGKFEGDKTRRWTEGELDAVLSMCTYGAIL